MACARELTSWGSALWRASKAFFHFRRVGCRFDDEPGQGAFRAWLHQIVRRRIADYRRREVHAPAVVGGSSFAMRLAELPFQGEPRSDASARSENAVGQAMAIVQREVETKTWQAFWMCVVDQHSTEEVAKLLEMTPANVRQCRSRVLRRLRQSMASSEPKSL